MIAPVLLLAFADLAAVQSHLGAGRYQDALSLLRQAPQETAPWHILASKAYDGLNDPARAVAEAESALRLEPASEAAHLQLGFIFLSRNTPAAATDVFREASRLLPDSLPIRLGLGLALKELQRFDEAEEVLPRCWPSPIAFDALATVYLHRSKFAPAKALAERFTIAAPNDYRGPYFLAAAKDGLQEPGALELVRRSLALKPDFAAAHALAGKIHLREGRSAEAVDAYRIAIRYRPDLTQAHLQLAQAYRKLGNDDDAAREIEIVRRLKAEEARPKPSLLYHRGAEKPQ